MTGGLLPANRIHMGESFEDKPQETLLGTEGEAERQEAIETEPAPSKGAKVIDLDRYRAENGLPQVGEKVRYMNAVADYERMLPTLSDEMLQEELENLSAEADKHPRPEPGQALDGMEPVGLRILQKKTVLLMAEIHKRDVAAAPAKRKAPGSPEGGMLSKLGKSAKRFFDMFR